MRLLLLLLLLLFYPSTQFPGNEKLRYAILKSIIIFLNKNYIPGSKDSLGYYYKQFPSAV